MRVLVWNIDQANREDRYPETTWDKRSPAVKALIKRANADIVCLVELRALKTSRETPEQFIASFPEYAAVSRPYSYHHDCFTMAVFYKRELLFAMDTRVVMLGEDPVATKLLMFTDFVIKATGTRFTVGVTHFDLPEEAKWRSVEITTRELLAQPLPTFVYGDYNFFDDRDGVAQRNKMLEHFPDLAAPLPFIEPAVRYSGTFVGFPHDEFKKPAGGYSRLDHVFSHGITAGPASFPFIDEYQLDNSSYATYTYPSDHLAIEFDINME